MNETAPKKKAVFESRMSKVQRVLGWLWLPMHIFALPLMVFALRVADPTLLTDAQAELAVYSVSAVGLLLIMFRFWKREFEALLDEPFRAFISVLLGLAITYLLNTLAGVLLLGLLDGEVSNPNNEAVLSMAGQDLGAVKAAAIILAPLVEETLFRGVIFGSLRRKHRVLAYVVSTALFCLLHVWQFVLAYGPSYLIYALQYVPASIALARCYERSGSLWAPMVAHGLINALAFAALS